MTQTPTTSPTPDPDTLLEDLRRSLLRRSAPPPRRPGQVSDDCARLIGAHAVQYCEKFGTLEALCADVHDRDALVKLSRQLVGTVTRNALTTSDIPLPVQYGSEMRELISEFGIARRNLMHYPIGKGVARPARMGLRPAFASIAMSGSFPEKSPTLTFASLESHKVGGIVRLPREIDEQSMVSMGQFLARYGAIEFARLEDNWAFNADGSPTYENVKGIITIAKENTKTAALPAGKTKPSDATLDDFRAVRRMVNKAALNGKLSCYFLDTTWETRLPSFRSAGEPNVYQRLPDGSARLDGYPIVWTDVLKSYDTTADPDKAIAVFGAPQFWWFGEHGSPRIDMSQHVYFGNDQIGVRFIEEIDFDYCALDATAALFTAAS
jgi:HK97 family phage major capsid protein